MKMQSVLNGNEAREERLGDILMIMYIVLFAVDPEVQLHSYPFWEVCFLTPSYNHKSMCTSTSRWEKLEIRMMIYYYYVIFGVMI